MEIAIGFAGAGLGLAIGLAVALWVALRGGFTKA